MAVSSLSKMTVPLASDQSASTQGLLMPKLKYRFRVMFENFGSPGDPKFSNITLKRYLSLGINKPCVDAL